jgi:predicted ATPase
VRLLWSVQLSQQCGVVFQGGGGVGVVRRERFLADRQGVLEERFGLLRAPLILVEQRQVIENDTKIGVIGAERAFSNGQGLLQEMDSLRILRLLSQVPAYIREEIPRLWEEDLVLGDEGGAGLHAWPEDGRHILAVVTGGPPRLSGHAEMIHNKAMLSCSERLPTLWYTGEVLCNSSDVVRYPSVEGIMVRRLPLVANHSLRLLEEPSDPIMVGSEAWYCWLAAEQHQSFAFRNQLGIFTVRRERRRQHGYWYLYHKREGKLRKAYLGKTEQMTLERLNAVAATVVLQGDLHDDAQAHVPAPRSTVDRNDHPLPTPLRPRASFTGSEHATPHNLPAQLTPLIGREQEAVAVCTLLRRPEVRLVTLTGTGGIGKTRLAVQVATEVLADFPDGVSFVSLASISDPTLVLSTIAQVLDVKESGTRPFLDLLTADLRNKHLLLCLDNFEHLLPAAPQLTDLLRACPHLAILMTSRAVLHLQGEHIFPVPPLVVPDLTRLPPMDTLPDYAAVTLFLQRAQAIQPTFQITSTNARPLAEVCIRLEGLPLAIELAAARISLFPPQALLPRLRNRLTLLVGGARDLPLRQQTLRGTIAWSYDLLEEAERRLIRRLSVFVGGCTLEAVEAICNAQGDLEVDVLDAVARLVDKSLLRQEVQADGEPRLLMLEIIREYAVERLAESGETEALRRRHATFFLAMAEQSERKLRSAEQSTWRRRLVVEYDNLRAALRWTLESQEAEMGLRLAGALLLFWRFCNRLREGRSWLEQVLAQPGAQGRTPARAKALRAAGAMAYYQGDFPEAHRLFEASVMVSREIGAAGKLELAQALLMLGEVALLQGNSSAAKELAGEGLQVCQEVGEAWVIAMALRLLGKATGELGDLMAARSLLEESAAQLRVIGDRRYLMMPVDALGMLALRQGDYAGARAHFEETLSVAQEMGDEPFIANALTHLGTVAFRMGDYPQSAALYQQSLALNREQGNKDGIVEDLAGLAAVASLLGQPERAARLFGAVEALREVSGIRLSPLRRADDDRSVEGIRAYLDEATFAAAWKEGRTMSLEQVITYALEAKGALPADAKSREAKQEDASSDRHLTPFRPHHLRHVVRCSSNSAV